MKDLMWERGGPDVAWRQCWPSEVPLLSATRMALCLPVHEGTGTGALPVWISGAH